MQLHELKPIHKSKKKKRVGRGGKRGTYSGRGIKGQKSRAGAKIRPAWRDLLKQIPKRRGRAKHSFKSIQIKPVVINIGELEKKFKDGEKITPQVLLQKGLIQKIKGKMPKVKILGHAYRQAGKGEAKKKFVIEGCEISKSVANICLKK